MLLFFVNNLEKVGAIIAPVFDYFQYDVIIIVQYIEKSK